MIKVLTGFVPSPRKFYQFIEDLKSSSTSSKAKSFFLSTATDLATAEMLVHVLEDVDLTISELPLGLQAPELVKFWNELDPSIRQTVVSDVAVLAMLKSIDITRSVSSGFKWFVDVKLKNGVTKSSSIHISKKKGKHGIHLVSTIGNESHNRTILSALVDSDSTKVFGAVALTSVILSLTSTEKEVFSESKPGQVVKVSPKNYSTIDQFRANTKLGNNLHSVHGVHFMFKDWKIDSLNIHLTHMLHKMEFNPNDSTFGWDLNNITEWFRAKQLLISLISSSNSVDESLVILAKLESCLIIGSQSSEDDVLFQRSTGITIKPVKFLNLEDNLHVSTPIGEPAASSHHPLSHTAPDDPTQQPFAANQLSADGVISGKESGVNITL
jgi:hypothetical protein